MSFPRLSRLPARLYPHERALSACLSSYSASIRALTTSIPFGLSESESPSSAPRTPAIDPAKVTQLKRPTRGGQDLSQRYERLERSLRGKSSYGRDIHNLQKSREVKEPAPYTTEASTQETSTSTGKVTRRIFRGFVVPDAPKPPADDECCMSGCAVCVYDLYDEARNDYIQAVNKLRADLTRLDVPESEWPIDVRRDQQRGSTASASKSNAALSAFEQLELALKAKREKESEVAASSSVIRPLAGPGSEVSEAPPVVRRRPPKKGVGINDVYDGLRWMLFSNR